MTGSSETRQGIVMAADYASPKDDLGPQKSRVKRSSRFAIQDGLIVTCAKVSFSVIQSSRPDGNGDRSPRPRGPRRSNK
jgi:hypothetical protein